MATIRNWTADVKRGLFDEFAFDGLFSTEVINQACRDVGHKWRQSFWSPSITVITLMLQVLDPSKTLRCAVAGLLTHLATRRELELPSDDPSAYCQARIKLPIETLEALNMLAARQLKDSVGESLLWRGRRVHVVDGTGVSMPDTPSLQEAFDQPSGQKAGCGFPVATIVAAFCWSTGAINDIMIDGYRPHELTLFRRMLDTFEPGDVVLGDRAYGSYVDIARLKERGVDGVFRLHQRRKADFREGRRLGKDDQIVIWTRPKCWFASCGLTREEFYSLPEEMPVRQIRINVAQRGFRSRTIIVVTTLLDPEDVPADHIRQLYYERWVAELNLRSLKIDLGMDVLRGKSPDVVRKEILMHVLIYNLIRILMWDAARSRGRDLHRLSFAGTMQRLRYVLPLVMFHRMAIDSDALIDYMLICVARDIVPYRPDRIEPRRVKRRPKQYSLLIEPRAWYHAHGDDHSR